jgi:hypothetical protein
VKTGECLKAVVDEMVVVAINGVVRTLFQAAVATSLEARGNES